MNYSKIYDYLMTTHSFFPYWLGEGKSFPPARIQLELTYRCNLRCAMCYQDKNSVPSTELETGEWIKIIKQLPKVCLITLIGGEPLIRNDFEEIVNSTSVSQRCNMVTNGVLLSEHINRFLIERKFLLVGVSLDGVDNIHDKMRGVKGTYKKVVFNLNDLQKQKIKKRSKYPLLDIKTVVTSQNQDNLYELFRKAEELKADFFTISMPKVCVGQFNPKMREEMTKLSSFDFSLFNGIDFKKVREVLKKIVDTRTKMKIRFYPNLSSIEELGKNLYNPKTIKEKFFSCYQPWSGVQITAKGDVYPCLSLRMGNIREKSFSEIWNSEKFVIFRKQLRRQKLFESCLGCCYLSQRK